MNLREKWDLRYEQEGRQRLNIFDPDMFTDEDQLQMWGEIYSRKGRKDNRSKKEKDISKVPKHIQRLLKGLTDEEKLEIIQELQ